MIAAWAPGQKPERWPLARHVRCPHVATVCLWRAGRPEAGRGARLSLEEFDRRAGRAIAEFTVYDNGTAGSEHLDVHLARTGVGNCRLQF